MELYKAENMAEARALIIALERAGVAATVEGYSKEQLGELKVQVSDADAEVAGEVLEGVLRRMRHTTGECWACGMKIEEMAVCSACEWSRVERTTGENAPQEDTVEEFQDVLNDSNERLTAKEKRVLWCEVVVVLAIVVIPSIFSFIEGFYLPSNHKDRYDYQYWHYALRSLFYDMSETYLVLFLIFRSGETWRQHGMSRIRFWDILLGLWMVLMGRVAYLVSSLLFPVISSQEVQNVTLGPCEAWEHWLMLARNAMGGFMEELIFRAYLIRRLSMLFRWRMRAVVVAAILFGTVHLYQGMEGFYGATFFGLVYGTMYLWTQRIWPLAIGHALYNINLDLHV